VKKTVLLSTLALTAAIAAMGQSHHVPRKFPMAGDHSAHFAAKTTTGNAARCIANSATVHLGPISVVIDTQSYAYSGARGGSVLSGVLKCDSSIDFQNNGGGLAANMKYAQTFDTHNNILTNTTQQWDASISAFGYYSQSTYTYDVMNNKLTETAQTWDSSSAAWVNWYKYTFTYNSANNMTTQLSQAWSGSAWTNNRFDTFTYNSSNLRMQDLSKTWNSVTSAWDTSSRDTFTYDASSNLATDVYQSWDVSAGWVTEYQSTYSNYAGAGLYQNIVGQFYDGSAFQNEYRDSITYSSYNQPVYYFEKNWNASSGSWNQDTFYSGHFYYELYSNSVSLINNAAAALDVYPNPASGLINIRVDVAGGKNTTITLQDIAGRVVRTIDGSNFKAGVNTIQCATDGLSAGTYFVHMANDKANVTRKVVIAK
jgi:hypothetical protein